MTNTNWRETAVVLCDVFPGRTTSQCQQNWHNHKKTHRKYVDTHTHPFNDPLSRTTWVSRYQKGKTNLDYTGSRDSEWQWHQLSHVRQHLAPDR